MLNTNNLGNYLKTRFEAKGLKDHEVFVAIIALARAGFIREEDVKSLVEHIFEGDEVRMIRGLTVANKIIDRELIEEILN